MSDTSRQKFPRGAKVKVADNMPPHMAHFKGGFIAIVEYSYQQKYGLLRDREYQYSLLRLDAGIPVESIAWYNEDQLTFVDGDRLEGLKAIEVYNYGADGC